MVRCLSGSLEDYLEAIYIAQESEESVGVTDIAKLLSFSKASVNRAINILKSESLVIQEKYGKISLTPKGKKAAKVVYKRHKILKKFFVDVLKIESSVAEADACKAEHILSLETLAGIEKFLNENLSEEKNIDKEK